MTKSLTIRYRGRLSGCNYDCPYCPFAKRKDSRSVLDQDRQDLERFCNWVASRTNSISILFTPWGEAVVRRYYRDALIRLSHLDHIGTVAIQTNMSHKPEWVSAANPSRIAFWITYHPGQTALAPFLARLKVLDDLDVAYSVGCVATREHFDAIENLRAALPSHIYFWINAEEDLQGTYNASEVERLVAIDPLFELNNIAYPTQGLNCDAGLNSITVRGDGSIWRCHFVEQQIGNIYDPTFEVALKVRSCPNMTCNCHIGYGQLPILEYASLYGEGLHERRAQSPTRAEAQKRLAAFMKSQSNSESVER